MGIGDSGPLVTLGKLESDMPAAVWTHCPASLVARRPRQVWPHHTSGSWEALTAAGTPARAPPGREEPRRPRAAPAHQSGTALVPERCPRDARGRLPAQPGGRPGNTDHGSEPTCPPGRRGARSGGNGRPPPSLSGARGQRGRAGGRALPGPPHPALRVPSAPTPAPPRPRARCCPSWPFAGPPARAPGHGKLGV